MNILQILPELNVGGVETGTLDLARHLIRLGHKTVVVSNGGVLVKELESYGAIHYQLPVHKKSIPTMFKMVRRLAEIIKEEKIEVVHARSRVPAWIAYFATRKTNTVFVTTCHGYYKRHPFSYVMGWAKRVIVISSCIGRHMVDDFGVPYERIRLIARSVDLDKFKYINPSEKKRQEFNVGIIGRITPLKGHLDFIKAMARVARVVPQLKVWIVGEASSSDQAYKEQLKLLIKRLGLWQTVQFLGTQRDIPSILSNLDLLVLATTAHEAFGRVIVEAQASGVPVVATRVGGVVDIIEDNKNGILIPPADPVNMAEAVIKVYRDKELASRLANEAYRRVKERYSVHLMVKNTLDVYRDAISSFKILIIKLSSLGDVILSTAAIKATREKFSQHKISVIVAENVKEVLLECPYIDELLICDLKNKDSGLRGLLRLASLLRKKNFDLVIDLQNNRRSHLLSYLTLSLNRYGYNNGKLGFLLNHSIKDDFPAMDPVTHQFRILGLLGIELPLSCRQQPPAESPCLELWPRDEDQRFIDDFLNAQWLSANQKIIGINISASKRWATKNWPLRHIAKLCEELGRRDMRVVITGTEKELKYVDVLASMVKDAKLINACAKTSVNQLACLIKRCAVYISPDSASLHIAASQDTPFVALFGPTDYRRHLPRARKFIVIKKDLPCSPCYKSNCNSKKCMELIKPEEVLEAIEKLL
jgi:lipopolysaccharide heptosyltransferase II